jgi:hypothetical protein
MGNKRCYQELVFRIADNIFEELLRGSADKILQRGKYPVRIPDKLNLAQEFYAFR